VLDAAAREANLYGAELVLIHCSERDESVDEAKRVLDAASCAPQATAVASVSARLATQPLAATFAAEADGQTLVVVGQHHTWALTSALLGSTAVELVRAAALPVLVVAHAAGSPTTRS
jgi:nucleotide-binding universal stress UspA family protein